MLGVSYYEAPHPFPRGQEDQRCGHAWGSCESHGWNKAPPLGRCPAPSRPGTVTAIKSVMASEIKMVGHIMVRKTKMMGGTNRHIFSAYEPGQLCGDHGTITTEDGVWYGQIGTKRTPGIEKMRGGSPERIAACDAFRKSEGERARALIVAAFPEAAEGSLLWGDVAHEIEVGS